LRAVGLWRELCSAVGARDVTAGGGSSHGQQEGEEAGVSAALCHAVLSLHLGTSSSGGGGSGGDGSPPDTPTHGETREQACSKRKRPPPPPLPAVEVAVIDDRRNRSREIDSSSRASVGLSSGQQQLLCLARLLLRCRPHPASPRDKRCPPRDGRCVERLTEGTDAAAVGTCAHRAACTSSAHALFKSSPPPVVLLDEISACVDANTARRMCEVRMQGLQCSYMRMCRHDVALVLAEPGLCVPPGGEG
jgi:hypothetical protein